MAKTLDFWFIVSGVSVYNVRSLMLSSLSDHDNETLSIFSSRTLEWSRSAVKVWYTY
ncbi:hypothetical protein K435DRAFT_784972 [Dendrothele bispora CBS 962.96]|uniref:Uncharacterized protein n=1 Tax=Dendrothele bispora (strain CBS 962.96) TaxID=1314807 RepID=A0A4S8KZN6_DENBC|nr:hypothetical protein K435DRAFT_784972 [Dendrothele bispora CBS 962.96]